MHVRSAPTRFCVPSVRHVGPNRICSSVAADADLDARAARQARVRRGHAPVVAAARRFGRLRERRADHDRVGAAGERLAHVAAGAHAAVGDDRHVAAGARDRTRRARRRSRCVAVTCGTPMPSTSRLVQAAPGPDADQQAGDAGLHQLERRREADAVADHDRDAHARDRSGRSRAAASPSCERKRREVTVDWTTKTSTPASAATGPSRSARLGVDETAATHARGLDLLRCAGRPARRGWAPDTAAA